MIDFTRRAFLVGSAAVSAVALLPKVVTAEVLESFEDPVEQHLKYTQRLIAKEFTVRTEPMMRFPRFGYPREYVQGPTTVEALVDCPAQFFVESLHPGIVDTFIFESPGKEIELEGEFAITYAESSSYYPLGRGVVTLTFESVGPVKCTYEKIGFSGELVMKEY